MQRRRYEGVPWLVLRHNYVELDGIADEIWRSCGEGKTIAEITTVVAERFACPLNEALAATVAVLEFLREEGFVRYPRAGEDAEHA